MGFRGWGLGLAKPVDKARGEGGGDDIYGTYEDIYGTYEDTYGTYEDIYGTYEDIYGTYEDIPVDKARGEGGGDVERHAIDARQFFDVGFGDIITPHLVKKNEKKKERVL